MCYDGYEKGMVYMKSRMDKYYDVNDTKARTTKNQQLYRTIYDEVEYSNVEGISIIEKNEKIDMDMIRDLINKSNELSREKKEPIRVVREEVIEDESDRIYDIRDVLSKAKDNRVVDRKRINDTQYNILKGISVEEEVISTEDLKQDDLKSMIDAISSNSKGYTTNLLDDLRSIYDPTMHDKIEEKLEETVEEKPMTTEIDNSFYTSKMKFKDDDFEDIDEIKEEVESSSILTKVLIVVLSLIIVVGIIFLVFHFIK